MYIPSVFGMLKAASTPALFGHPNTSTEMLVVIWAGVLALLGLVSPRSGKARRPSASTLC